MKKLIKKLLSTAVGKLIVSEIVILILGLIIRKVTEKYHMHPAKVETVVTIIAAIEAEILEEINDKGL